MSIPVEARSPSRSSPSTAVAWRPSWRDAAVVAALIATFWVVRYWHSASFGLYEDDLTNIPRAIQMTGAELLRFVSNYIIHLYGHAGPLDESLIYIFSNLGWRLDRLQGIYFVGFAVESLNILLFFALLRRLQARIGFALIGGLAYALFSADTTQSLLTHSLSLQPSLTLLLLALHAWLSDRRSLAYLLSFVILFAYETPYPVFLGAPLLNQPWDRRLPRTLLLHATIVTALLLAATGVKALAGEERVADLTLAQAILTPLNHMIVGPAVSLATFGLRPLEALAARRGDVLVLILAATGVFTYLLIRFDVGSTTDFVDSVAWLRERLRRLRRRKEPGTGSPRAAPPVLRLGVAGLAMWVLAYPLTFTTFGYHIRGRPTRVHLAAVVGSSIAVASVATALLQAAPGESGRRWRMTGLAAWFGLMAGYGFVLQKDYSDAWALEGDFWSRLVPLVQDAGEGSVILVDPAGIRDTYQIAANTWNLPRVLEQLFILPASWKAPPRVFRLADSRPSSLLEENGSITLDQVTTVAPPSLYGEYAPDRTMLIDTGAEPWSRRFGAVTFGDNTVTLRPAENRVLATAGHTPLYDLLIRPGESSSSEGTSTP